MNHEEALDRVKAPALLEAGDRSHWLALKDDDFHHLSCCAVNIVTGEVKHLSKLALPIHFASWHEVMM